MFCYVVLCCDVLRYVALYCVLLCYGMFTLCYVWLCCVMLCSLCCVVMLYVGVRYVVVCSVML